MSGDYSRFTDRPRKRYSGVLMQQGRVQLDADWNEEVDLLERRDEVTALDTFGPLAVPAATTPDGFLITPTAGDLKIGAGRIYVDGLLAELFDGEKAGGQLVSYLHQPFFPDPPSLPNSDALVYLDVWHREVTWVEDPDLLEKALGGVDTTTRRQTVWQVRVEGMKQGQKAECGLPLPTPPTGRLSSRAVAPPKSDDPCILSPTGGYRGLENRLYRVEVHKAGDTTTARLKWSQENASVVSPVSKIEPDGAASKLTVARIGRDKVLRFQIDDWVEVLDDPRELMGEPGEMAKVVKIDEAAQTITLDRAVPAGGTRAFGANALELRARHTRVRRWDQKKDLENGLVKASTSWTPLGDDGVEILLSPAGGTFRTGDYWVFAARTVDASVEELDEAPPRGIVHHYGQLAAISGGQAHDCRPLWPPKGECCCCTAEVGDGKTSHGDYDDLQQAVEELSGKVKENQPIQICLLPGIHVLRDTVVLGRDRITIRGCGRGARVIGPRRMPAFVIKAYSCALENLYLASDSETADTGVILCTGTGNRLEGNEIETSGAPAIEVRDAEKMQIRRNRLSHSSWAEPREGDERPAGMILLVGSAELIHILDNDLGPGITSGILLAAPLLQGLFIRDNLIHDLQGSGIDTAMKRDWRAEHLWIERNTISGCIGRFAPLRSKLPHGGIILARAAKVRIAGNHIEANGRQPDLKTPVAGIYVGNCKGLIVRDNTVVDNGLAQQDGKGAAGRQGGILAEDLWVTIESVEITVPGGPPRVAPLQPDGWPAAAIQDNLVVAPRGPALLLTGIGPMLVTGNRLTARDILEEEPFPYSFAGAVCIVNGGMPAYASSQLAAGGFQTDKSFDPAVAQFGFETVGGKVEFTDNQVVLDLIRGEIEGVLAATLLLSLDDVAVQNNQTQCSLFIDLLIADVLAIGTTVRATGNGLTESLAFALVSLWSAAFLMNLTTDNQGTHCILAECLTSKLVDAPNQELLCNDQFRGLHFFPR
jgi:hypothetical protein